MKIVLECFIDIESGPVFTIGFAKGLINNGVEVYAIINRSCENLSEWESLLDSNHLYIVQSELSIRNHPIQTIQEMRKIKEFSSKNHFDFYIDTFPINTTKYVRYAIKSQFCIGIDHDVIPHSSTDTIRSKKTKNEISNFDYVLVLSRFYQDLAASKYDKPLSNILYMRHGAMEYPECNVQYINDNHFDINFLYFGRIDGYKGLHVLSKAFSHLVSQYNNISLTVAGGGDFSEYEKEYAALPNCTVLNKYLTDEEIAYYFCKTNTVLVLPYLDASQSGVIGMAFNYRTPIIVSDTGGLKEQLFDGEMGLFVKPGDSVDLHNKMEEFITNKALYQVQKEKMDCGYKKSTWDYVTRELLDQLESIES